MSQSPNDSNEPQEDIIDLIEPIASNSNNAHVEMAESTLTKLEESLECPVCYKIPRNVPISCCEAGHIVCQPGMGKSGLFCNQNRPNKILRPQFRSNKYKYTKRKTNNIKQ